MARQQQGVTPVTPVTPAIFSGVTPLNPRPQLVFILLVTPVTPYL
jgi:hypothetical protein